MDTALAGVAERGTAAWRFGDAGWPQDKIKMHAKTGTAEVAGKQTTSWFTTYTKDYTIVMTISQGGTGSGASGPAVRNIYNAIYGVNSKGEVDEGQRTAARPGEGPAQGRRPRQHRGQARRRIQEAGGARGRGRNRLPEPTG